MIAVWLAAKFWLRMSAVEVEAAGGNHIAIREIDRQRVRGIVTAIDIDLRGARQRIGGHEGAEPTVVVELS